MYVRDLALIIGVWNKHIVLIQSAYNSAPHCQAAVFFQTQNSLYLWVIKKLDMGDLKTLNEYIKWEIVWFKKNT